MASATSAPRPFKVVAVGLASALLAATLVALLAAMLVAARGGVGSMVDLASVVDALPHYSESPPQGRTFLAAAQRSNARVERIKTEKVEPFLVQHQNVEVDLSSGKDVYMVRFFRLPKMDAGAGITAMKVVRSGEAQKFVHHVSLYGCNEGFEPPRVNTSFPDKSDKQGTGCSRKIHSFNVNSLSLELPEGYMYPLDSEHVKLTVHYKALQVREFVVDSTGILMEFGSSLKTMQYLELGPKSPKMLSIPPRSARHVVESLCSPDDVAAAMGRLSLNEVEIIGAQTHMHLAGVAFKSEVLHSNGTSTPFTVQKVYSLEDQRSRFLPRSIVVSKGDALKVTCVYNTQGRSGRTKLGFNIRDEMCISGILMSPRLPSFYTCYHVQKRKRGVRECTGIHERKPFTVAPTTDVRGPEAEEAKAAIFLRETSACLGGEVTGEDPPLPSSFGSAMSRRR